MQNKTALKVALCTAVSALLAIGAHLLSRLVINISLGSGAYGVSYSDFYISYGLIIGVVVWIFMSKKREEKIIADDTEDFDPEPSSMHEIPQIDLCEYPELLHKKEEEGITETIYPDVRKILSEQKGDVTLPLTDEPDITSDAWEDFISSSKSEDADSTVDSIYENIPEELPEGYTEAVSEDAEGDDYECFDEEEYFEPMVPPYIPKAAALIFSILLAVFLPVNLCTVYTPDGVTVRRFADRKSYSYTDALEYKVGVQLSGELSVKATFDGNRNVELVWSNLYCKSKSFAESYQNAYSYAVSCDRAMKNAGIKKTYGNLSGLNTENGVSEAEVNYINEILGK